MKIYNVASSFDFTSQYTRTADLFLNVALRKETKLLSTGRNAGQTFAFLHACFDKFFLLLLRYDKE